MRKKFLVVITLSFLLSGCFNVLGYDTHTVEFERQRFTEAVRLSDGSEINVRAETTPGTSGHAFHGAKVFAINIRRTLPDGVVWSNEDVTAHILDRDARSWIVVAEPHRELYSKYGCPTPPHVYFRYLEKKWLRVSASDIPDRLRVNLLLQRVHAIGDAKHYSVAEKDQKLAALIVRLRKEYDALNVNAKTQRKPPVYDFTSIYGDFSKTCDPQKFDCARSRWCDQK